MNLFGRLRGRKAASARTTPTGSITYLGGVDQGSSKRMANYRSLLGAISVPNVWKCISVIAANAAATPLLWLDEDGAEVDIKTSAPELYALLRRPNPEMRSLAFSQAIVFDLLLTGNFFCLLDSFDGLGRPHELFRIPPDRARLVRSDVGRIAYGQDVVVDGVPKTVWHDDTSVLHIKTFFNPSNPLFGLGPTEASELSISRDRLIGEFSLNYFSKGAICDSVLVSQNEVSEEDRKSLIESWNAFRSGNRNRFKTAVLSSGVTFEKIQESVADVQLPQLANMALEDVCQAYGVPKEMLGSVANTSYRNAQEANSFFITETLSPLLQQIIEDFWRPLGELFDPDLEPDYRLKEVHDFQLRSESALRLAQSGAATVNDVLVMAGLDPRDDELGEKLVQPAGVMLVEPDAAGAPPEPGVKSYPEALLSRKQRDAQRKRGVKHLAPRDPAEGILRLLQSPQDAPESAQGIKAQGTPPDAPEGSQGREERRAAEEGA